MDGIENCEGYKKLLAEVEISEKRDKAHDYRGHLAWIIERVQHYSENTGIKPDDILNAWEKHRDYWFMNYYQDSHQPKVNGEQVEVFEDLDTLKESLENKGFRCPNCNGISKSPYECGSGLDMSPGKKCNWKSYGLFGTLGKGVYVFIKSEIIGNNIFMPVAWESEYPHE